MNRIKNVLLMTIVLLFASCGFFENTAQTYIGTISVVKQKKEGGSMMGLMEGGDASYKLEILTSEGVILRGRYDDTADKYKPGDFVKVTIDGDRIENLEIMDRAIMDSHF